MKILFKYTTDEYGCLSNFSPHPITDDEGRVWPTTEHFYQGMKFSDREKQELVRSKPTPKAAKVTACSLNGIYADWDERKISVMEDALWYKVNQHPEIKNKLLASGENELVESSNKDYFWGNGADGTGSNVLGTLWMSIRKAIRNV